MPSGPLHVVSVASQPSVVEDANLQLRGRIRALASQLEAVKVRGALRVCLRSTGIAGLLVLRCLGGPLVWFSSRFTSHARQPL